MARAPVPGVAHHRSRVIDGQLCGKDNLALRVGKVVKKYKTAKHFELDIGEATLGWSRRQDRIDAEAALDGLYIIRTQ